MSERKPYPSETQDRFLVRFPEGMRSQIAELAKANRRSMNAEIIARLHESLTRDLPPPSEEQFDESLKAIPREEREEMIRVLERVRALFSQPPSSDGA